MRRAILCAAAAAILMDDLPMERKWMILLFLAVNAGTDIYSMEVPCAFSVCFCVSGLICRILPGGLPPLQTICLLPCLLFAMLSGLRKEPVGQGDALVLCALSPMMTPEEMAGSLAFGLLLCGIFCVLVLAADRGNRESRIPFIPFLLAGYLGGGFL